MVGDDALGSELRGHVRAERIILPKTFFERSNARIALSAATPFAFIGLAILSVSSGLGAIGWPLGFIFVLFAQRHFQTLVHDASHNFYHRDRRISDRLASFLSAGFIGMTVENYRALHFEHHVHNGSKDDPEHVSFRTVTELGGLTMMILRYALMMEMFRLVKKYYFPDGSECRERGGPGNSLVSMAMAKQHILVCQLVLFSVFVAASVPLLYLLWVYVALTFSPLMSRLRFLVEHPGESDLTITTEAPRLELWLFAPLAFNYHFEHHCWPTLPPYRHRNVHKFLAEKGFFDRHPQYFGTSFIGALVARSRVEQQASAVPLSE